MKCINNGSMTVDEYVLVEVIDGGDALKMVTNGYDNLKDAEFSMDNYPDKTAEIRIIAFLA